MSIPTAGLGDPKQWRKAISKAPRSMLGRRSVGVITRSRAESTKA
jgi:hypothetical protein